MTTTDLMPAVTIDLSTALPLGREQKALEPNPGAPLVLTATLEGPLDTTRLQHALHRVAERHPATGLAFGHVEGLRGLRQQFTGALPVLRGDVAPPSGSAAFTATLTALGVDRHRLALSAHPLALDGASLAILCRELALAYAGTAAPGDEAPLTYGDYLEWTAGLARDDAEAGRDYWQQIRERTAGVAAPRLPWRARADGDAAQTAPAARAERSEDVPIDEAHALQRWADSLAQPLPRVLQAAWWLLLARLDPAGAFRAGWQHDCRDEFDALAGATGRYASVLPLFVAPDATAPFNDWLGHLGTQLDQHLDWREHCPHDAAGSAPGQIGFVMDGASPETLVHGALTWRITPSDAVLPVFELAAHVRTDAAGVPRQMALHVAHASYRDDAVACLLDQYRTLLRTLRTHPDTALGALPLATATDIARREAMHVPTIDTGTEMLPQRVARWGSERPQQPALSAAGLQLDYAGLNRHVDALAARLPRLGLQPGTPVGLLLPRSGELVVALLAVMRAGAAYLPLDPSWPPQRRVQVLADAGATLVLTDAAHLPAISHATGCPPHVDVAMLLATTQDAAAQTQDLPDAGADAPAYVLYTSGSTGTPKGVAITHGQLLNYVVASGRALGLADCACFALTSTVAADLGNTTLFGALWHGACLSVADEADMARATTFAAFLARERVDCIKIVPSHLDALLEELEEARRDGLTGNRGALPLASDAVIVLGGERASPALLARLRERAPQARICNHYGPTETTIGIVVHDAGRADADADADADAVGDGDVDGALPLTHVLANCEAEVRTAAGHLATVGEAGELYLGGAQLCNGYLGRAPGAADDPFVPDPHRPGRRMYRSGDLARYLPQGGLELLGRADQQVKVRGFRVECGEIEHALAALPGVRQAVVLPVTTDGNTRLVAWVVPDEAMVNAGLNPASDPAPTVGAIALPPAHRAALRTALAERLPEPMLPAQWLAIASVPRLANGKVDRRALIESAASASHADTSAAREPANAVEALLLDQMRELLDMPALRVQDDLFEAGGHSLLVIKLVARVRKLLKLDIAPAVVFDAPSAAALAIALGQASQDPAALDTLAGMQRQLAAMSPEARAALRNSAGAA